ncbi:hypothetical protein O988_00028 [Pseudogymnoascus sp. VKM F-3808]|nr:hypothetical protein O988_00028 [Pseudogymnoascus sp. VKM F-3808]
MALCVVSSVFLSPVGNCWGPFVDLGGEYLFRSSEPYCNYLHYDHHVLPDCMGNNGAKQDIELISETSSPNLRRNSDPSLFSHNLTTEDQSPKSTQPTAYQCPPNLKPKPSSAATPDCRCTRWHRLVTRQPLVVPAGWQRKQGERAALPWPSRAIGWYGIGARKSYPGQ